MIGSFAFCTFNVGFADVEGKHLVWFLVDSNLTLLTSFMSFYTSPHSVRYNFVFLNSGFLESYIKPIIYMKNYLPLCIILVWIFSPIYCFSQDPSFSQFYNAKSYLNPATIGIEEGLSIAANSRLQWLAIDRGFLSNYVSFEKREPLLI